MIDVSQTIAGREPQNGNYDAHAAFTQAVIEQIRATDGWSKLSAVHKHSLSCIADKIARILNGDPNHSDHWHDIQGYAKLAEDRCIDTETPQLPLDPERDESLPPLLGGTGWERWPHAYVPMGTEIQIQYRNGIVDCVYAKDAYNYRWGWEYNHADIVAIRVIAP